MVRNIVLLVSTAVVLVVLFVGYALLVRDPATEQDRETAPLGLLPDEVQHAPTEVLQVGPVTVPPGGRAEFTRYDERTGQPIDRFCWDEWSPVAGSKNEIAVVRPELTTRLPSGMVAVISAERGQLSVERLEKSNMRPKLGWLAGNARIVIDRQTATERSSLSTRPEDAVTITMDRLDFDLELGELKTADRVEVASPEFEVAGTGLRLVWNQADNRMESLLLERGEQLVLYGRELFGGLGGSPRPSPDAQPVASQATQERSATVRPQVDRKRRSTAYACVLTGPLVAAHYRGEQLLDGLTARELRLLFDMGGGASRVLGRRAAPASAPAATPTNAPHAERERLVVRWDGPLTLAPAAAPPDGDRPRRRLEAIGEPLKLTNGDAQAVCGRVEYYDETEQVWLHPTDAGRVDFTLGEGLTATARNVYIDNARRVVKLIGDVVLESTRGPDQSRRPTSIRCSEWAELHLAAGGPSDTPDAAAPARGLGRLESALFVGDVWVELTEQQLGTQRLALSFYDDGQKSFETALRSAVASGGVRLLARDESVECAQLALAFATTPDGELYPRQMEATGAVVIQRARLRLSGRQVRAALEPVATDASRDTASIVLRTLDVLGDAELRDPRRRVYARGERIAAVFAGSSELARATVTGAPARHAVVHAEPYTVRGETIVLERDAQTVRVDGPSRLGFKAQWSLQGRQRREPTPVVITSERRLHVDGRGNRIYFEGDVKARTGTERLEADTLALALTDVPDTSAPRARLGKLPAAQLLRQAWQVLSGQSGRAPDGPATLTPDARSERIRKEPVRLLATHAVASSEARVAGDELPLTLSSLTAPKMEVDIPLRLVRTSGQTTLFLLNRELDGEQESQRDVLGIPSALLTRGPSQTVMQCDGAMTYHVGEAGPQQRDYALFEGGVWFQHRAGREMVNLEQMLPAAQNKPELTARLPSRRTNMECDRLECVLVAGGGAAGTGTVSTEGALRLSLLIARGHVNLRDVQGGGIRTVQAGHVEFDRQTGSVLVRGSAVADARVYYENPDTGEFAMPAIGPEFVIDLKTNRIRSKDARGEFYRP